MNANVPKTPYYKERVEKIEKEILAITNNATYTVFSGDDAAYLLTLLNDRKWLLDAMFVVTPEEFARMNEVNERLRELTHELHHQVADAHEKAKRAFLGKEFTVEATLKFVSTSDGAMIVRPNDDYYGSDFAKILQVIDMLFGLGFFTVKCAYFVRASDLVNNFDYGNWETAYEYWQPQADKFKYINICFAIHSLNAYHPYSIPDILRMNNFDVTVTIKKIMTM